MSGDLDLYRAALEECLRQNRGPGYRLEIIGLRADGCVEARVTLLAGRRYCCFQPGCHLPQHVKALKGGIERLGLELPDFEVSWMLIIEVGASCDLNGRLLQPSVSRGAEYEYFTSRSRDS